MSNVLRIPQDLADVIDPTFEFKPATVAAVKALAKAKAWQGDFDRRFKHLSRCVAALCKDHPKGGKWQLTHVGSKRGVSGMSRIDPTLKRIELRGRLSVVTMLHLFARAQGIHPVLSIKWSINLFARCFPGSYKRCRLVNGVLVNDGRRDDDK